MKFYLSSYKVGEKSFALELKEMIKNKKIAYISNALDSKSISNEKREMARNNNFNDLKNLGIEAEWIDLKDYFGKENDLERKLDEIGSVWINGGNTFILMMAMRLSGMDKYLHKNLNNSNFVYAGYSAAICCLAKDFKSLQIVDDPNDFPYESVQKVNWEGLGFTA
eukprot:TRINITY_DN1452_c0_g2_i1.p1 TRINITY_DN1452_c0_g2~~TRINITY_DN1452_c0_g2_i1.p1  ORF type:complete len:166 (-),score=40.71 TRINITY_DN1452_c0_g2_i1:107-604(-)